MPPFSFLTRVDYDHWAQPQWPLSRGGLSERMESSGRFFTPSFPLNFSWKRSLVACKSFVWHIRAQVEYLFLSRGCILLSSDLSNFFSWRERRVFLVRSCSCVNSWEIENIILRDLFRASHERERIKNFSKDCDGRVKFVISQVTVS